MNLVASFVCSLICLLIILHIHTCGSFASEIELIQMAVTPEMEHPRKAFGWAAKDTSGVLSPFKFSRRYWFLYLWTHVSFTCSIYVILGCKIKGHLGDKTKWNHVVFYGNMLQVHWDLLKWTISAGKRERKMWHSKCCTVGYVTQISTWRRTNGAIPLTP